MYIETKQGFCYDGDESLLTFNGINFIFKDVVDLAQGDIVCIDRSSVSSEDEFPINYKYLPSRYATNTKNVVLPQKYSPAFGEWLGYVVANGATSANCVLMSSNESAKTVNYEGLVEKLFSLKSVKVKGDKGSHYFKIYSVVVKEFLDNLTGGFKTARYKSVPEGIFKSSTETQRKFLRALFDCDASKLKSSFEYSSASEELTRGVVSLLLGFGIIARAKRVYAKEYPDHTYWKVHISGTDEDILYDKILYDSYKYLPLEPIKRNTNIDVIYGFKEYLIYEVNKARKQLGVNRAGSYKYGDKWVRFTAAKTISTACHKDVTYNILRGVYNDFDGCREE